MRTYNNKDIYVVSNNCVSFLMNKQIDSLAYYLNNVANDSRVIVFGQSNNNAIINFKNLLSKNIENIGDIACKTIFDNICDISTGKIIFITSNSKEISVAKKYLKQEKDCILEIHNQTVRTVKKYEPDFNPYSIIEIKVEKPKVNTEEKAPIFVKKLVENEITFNDPLDLFKGEEIVHKEVLEEVSEEKIEAPVNNIKVTKKEPTNTNNDKKVRGFKDAHTKSNEFHTPEEVASLIRASNLSINNLMETIDEDIRIDADKLKSVSPDNIISFDDVKIDYNHVLGRGLEGTVYGTFDKCYVAKVFNEYNDELEEKLIDLLKVGKLLKQHNVRSFIFPLAIKKIDGELTILMKKAEGHNLRCSVSFFKQKFPKWKMSNIAIFIQNIVKAFKDLHSFGIILGDLREDDIFVKEDGSVEFCDTSSYQFSKYNCSLLSPDFRSPKYIDHDEIKLRTFEDDLYVLTVLIFKIFMNDKTPYYNLGDEELDEIANIRYLNFPYPLIAHDQGRLPANIDPRSYAAWLRLDYSIREYLYKSFTYYKLYTLDETIKVFKKFEV